MSAQTDSLKYNDNRNYQYNSNLYERHEFPIISSLIPKGANVIDLGCGNGALLSYLIKHNKINGEGLEISDSGVTNCLNRGLKVRIATIDKKSSYDNYANNFFDYAICNVTIQMVKYPEILLQQMKRISKYQIISFPNFAYIENRLELMFNGIMPRKMLYGYTWYNTGHIHQLSLKDFKKFCINNNIKILKRKDFGCLKTISQLFWPNLLSKESLFLCKKNEKII